MPYRKSYYPSRRYGGGARRPYRKGYVAKTAYQVAKRVVHKSKPQRECRFQVSGSLNSSSIPLTFKTWNCTLIDPGPELDQRDGNKIWFNGLRFSVGVNNQSTTKRFLRIMVLKQRNQSGVVLDTSAFTNLFTDDIFEDDGGTGLVTDVQQPINTGICEVFYDRTYALRPEAEGTSHMALSKYVKIGRTVEFDDRGDDTDVNTGKIFLVMHISEAGTVGTSGVCQVNGMIRSFYKDA